MPASSGQKKLPLAGRNVVCSMPDFGRLYVPARPSLERANDAAVVSFSDAFSIGTLHRLFRRIDTKRCGFISADDMMKAAAVHTPVFRMLGCSGACAIPSRIERFIVNGKMTFSGFVCAFRPDKSFISSPKPEYDLSSLNLDGVSLTSPELQDAWDLFAYFDRAGDGFRTPCRFG